MNLVKRQNPVYNSLIDELFRNQSRNPVNAYAPAVNIIEAEDHFDIQLATPGKKKEGFKIEMEEFILTISSEMDTKSTKKEESFTLKEFGYNSFKRSFNVPETVSVDKIHANYKEGVLTVCLPKKEEDLPQPKKRIAIK